jgi:phage nucleotide-binding protein
MVDVNTAVTMAAKKAAFNVKYATIAPNKIDRGLSFIIYSDPGVGKTTLSATLPVGETLIINTEAGIGPLLGSGHMVFSVKKAILESNVEQVMNDLYRDIRTGAIPDLKNVVIDNVSELVQTLLHHYTESRKKGFPELREQGDTSYKIMEWVNNWRDLVDMNINVVFNAWEFPYDIQNNDGTVVTKTCPMLGKASTFRACGLVDAVGHLEVFEKTGKRWIRFGPSKQYLTKCQFKGVVTTDNGVGAMQPDLTEVISRLKGFDYEKGE